MVFNRKTLEIVTDIERHFPVDEWTVDGLHVWPWLRILLMRQPQEEFEVRDAPLHERFRNAFRYRRERFLRLFQIRLLRKNEQKVHADAEIIFQNLFNKRMLFNDTWYDQHCDPLIAYLETLGIHSLVLERTGRLTIDNLPRAHANECASYNPILFDFLEKRKADVENIAHMQVHLPRHSEFVTYAKSKLPFLKESNFMETQLRKDIRNILLQKECFVEILKQNPRAKAAFIICYYHAPGMAFVLACRERGMLAIDLQHGCQHHTAYSKWLKVPRGGYDLLPQLFWNWDAAHATDINEWAKKTDGAHQAVVGGYPWVQMWKDKRSALTKLYDQKLDTVFGKSVVKILFSLNGLSEPVPRWVLEAMAASPPGWFWYVRPHPQQRKNAAVIDAHFASVCPREKYELQSNLDTPLPALLQYVDVHVTNTSSAILEAENFGVPSVAFDYDTRTTYPDQLASGIMVNADTPETLLTEIRSQMEKKNAGQFKPGVDGDAAMADTIKKVLEGAYNSSASPHL